MVLFGEQNPYKSGESKSVRVIRLKNCYFFTNDLWSLIQIILNAMICIIFTMIQIFFFFFGSKWKFLSVYILIWLLLYSNLTWQLKSVDDALFWFYRNISEP